MTKYTKQELITQFIEDLEAQIDFETNKDITPPWTKEYRDGFVDGLKQALKYY